MKTIRFNEDDILKTAGHSSKGNQPKWYSRGKWYKADHMGYEGLSEVLVSRLLQKSTTFEVIEYHPVKIEFGVHNISGCYSKNFLGPTEELIPLERLYRAYTGESLSVAIHRSDSVKTAIANTVEFVEQTTGLKNFGPYLAGLLEADAFFLNEDRHTNNIAVLYDTKTETYRLCPYFDFGLSLLSDLNAFWLEGDIDRHMQRVTAKPFGSFASQRQAAEALYGRQFTPNFTLDDLDYAFRDLEEYYRDRYRNRARDIIEKQLKKAPADQS